MLLNRDHIRIIRHLSLGRLWNLALLRLSFSWSRLTRKPMVAGKPFSVSIEPTTACNLGCPECPSGLKIFTRPSGKLELEKHARLLDRLGKQLFYVNYYFQGEPFLNPDFLALIRQAKQRKIYTATSTNAHFIDAKKAGEIVESGLDRLIISIDGTTQETYEKYRIHGQLEKVLSASKYLVQARKERKSATPHLIFQFLVVKPNEHQVEGVKKLAAEIGIDEVRLKTAQVYDYKHGNPLIPEQEKYARYVQNQDGTWRFKYKTENHCWRMWSSCVLTWDARVVPCCFDKDAVYNMGSLETHTLDSVWKNKVYQQFRKQILRNRNEIDICKNCSEGAKVWV